jgi:hypothetical protein
LVVIGTDFIGSYKSVERDKIDTPNIQVHDRSLSWLGTDTSIKSGGDKLVLWVQT